MKRLAGMLSILFLVCAGCRSVAAVHRSDQAAAAVAPAAPAVAPQGRAESAPDDLPGIGGTPDVVPMDALIVERDPLEPMNRAFFVFNDRLYFWLLKPVSRGYAYVVPAAARRGVRNAFSNITTPVRLVNSALQGEFGGAWVELERFGINTTVGVVGFGDPARNRWQIQKHEADLGQTLGRYGVGPWIYLNWPVIGPSNPRDTVGYVGDIFLDPVTYLVPKFAYDVGIQAYETVNGTSLRPGEYEKFKDAAIDPYTAFRDAYYQYRRHAIAGGETPAKPAGAVPQE